MSNDEPPIAVPASGPGLVRAVGLPGAVLLGLGSMVGTGVFVSIGIAAGVAGAAIVPAILLAAALACANGLSSAQLAAAHPVSGGSYEYGYRELTPALGFSAGWMFLLAKSASAATAAIGLAGYLLELSGVGASRGLTAAIAVAGTLTVTALVAGGIRRSNAGNAVLVTVTLAGLIALLAWALPAALSDGWGRLVAWGSEPIAALGNGSRPPAVLTSGRGMAPLPAETPPSGTGALALLHASALMFVAFTGYGRIATLGEEVREPRTVIPRAVIATLSLVTLLYLAVAVAGVGVLGSEAFGRAAETSAAPLQAVAEALQRPGLAVVVAVAALTAMSGVLLNLILGLSRVLLAMARRRDAPQGLARISPSSSSPTAAVWACGVLIAVIAATGQVRTTWSFSAFTVLVYYAITNLAAMRLEGAQRLYPRWIPVVGLVGCLGLAFAVELRYAALGCLLLAGGLVLRALLRDG